MMKGYTGRILRVDLTTGKIEVESLDDDLARKYLGGSGLCAKILWDETTADTDPFSPENPMVFMTGPFSGTSVLFSSKVRVATISPLTGILGEALAGGHWGAELKHAGFDGIVVKGKARNPVYLWIKDGDVKLVNADHVWGKDIYVTDEIIRKETDEKAVVLNIGMAGEKLVRIANVMIGGRDGATAARCGMGAVMGSKKLKAIVVRGTLKVEVHDEEKLKESVKEILPKITKRWREIQHKESSLSVRELARAGWRQLHHSDHSGDYPIKNWRLGLLEGSTELDVEARVKRGTPRYCPNCPTSCIEAGKIVEADGKEGKRITWEALAPLGPQCMITDLKALDEAFALCQRFGLECVSTGGVISFAMECFEKGLITKNDTDGIDLSWGNAEAMVEMVRKIGNREGFGELLGEGVRIAAERIGGTAQEYAMHVKGLELPAHDPRAFNGLALEYATSNVGAHHHSASCYQIEGEEDPVQRIQVASWCPYSSAPFEVKDKEKMCAFLQDLMCMMNSLPFCWFAVTFVANIYPPKLVEWLNYVTGWDMDLEEFMKTGERIFNLERMFNVRRGISRKDDTLPMRMLTHKNLPHKHLPPLGEMLGEYYSYRGWSEEGIPTKKKLEELGLEELAEYGYKIKEG